MQSRIEECGICESTVGAAGVAAWERLVLTPARDLLSRCEVVARLGNRYVWEALSEGGQLRSDYFRIYAACTDWEARATRAGIEDPGFFIETDEAFLEILSKLNRWKYWGSQPESRSGV